MPSISDKCICCGSSKLKKKQSILSPFFTYRMFNYTPLKIKRKQFNDIKHGYTYYACQTIECLNCGLVFLDQRFTKEELKKYYNNYQTSKFFNERIRFEKSFRSRLKKFRYSGIIAGKFKEISKIEKFILGNIGLPRKILDYGAGDGKGTIFRQNDKVKSILYDPFNFNKSKSTKSKINIKNNNFDLITFRNVLEHVSYPREILFDLMKIIKSRTNIYIEVPKEKLISKYKKGNRYKNKPIWTEHINFFTQDSLKKLLILSGLKILDIKELIINKGNRGKTDNDREHFMVLAKKR